VGGLNPPLFHHPHNIKRLDPLSKSDQALLGVMRANPGASLADLIRLGRRPRKSTVSSLKRLKEAGSWSIPLRASTRQSIRTRRRNRPGWSV
jgi:hypothetical protein